MSGSGSVLAWSSALEDFALFRTLSPEQRLKALNAMVRQDLVHGQMLVAQGGPSDSLFLVLHGALAVRKTGFHEPIAELRAGELVGEIGFFANVPRTADVIAINVLDVPADDFPHEDGIELKPEDIEQLIADPAAIERFAGAGRARVEQLYDARLVARATVAAIGAVP